MTGGNPLNDIDRLPWMETLRDFHSQSLERNENSFLPARLKRSYRDYLLIDKQVKRFTSKADRDLIQTRLKRASGHYMDPRYSTSGRRPGRTRAKAGVDITSNLRDRPNDRERFALLPL